MEQLREQIVKPVEKKFKKVLFGFEKNNVLEHINQLETNQKTSVSNYEKNCQNKAIHSLCL